MAEDYVLLLRQVFQDISFCPAQQVWGEKFMELFDVCVEKRLQ